MSRYQEISTAFNESVQNQAKYISDCCDFANMIFKKLAEYAEWPEGQMFFTRDMPDKFSHCEPNICDTTVVHIQENAYIYFFVIFTVKIEYLQNDATFNRSIQFTVPTKIRKFEDEFLVQIENSTKEHQGDLIILNATDTERLKEFYECVLTPMKRSFDDRFLNFTTNDFIRHSNTADD